VLWMQVTNMREEVRLLKEGGVDVESVEVEGGDHFLSATSVETVDRKVMEWVKCLENDFVVRCSIYHRL